jgi:hypothetical protein
MKDDRDTRDLIVRYLIDQGISAEPDDSLTWACNVRLADQHMGSILINQDLNLYVAGLWIEGKPLRVCSLFDPNSLQTLTMAVRQLLAKKIDLTNVDKDGYRDCS